MRHFDPWGLSGPVRPEPVDGPLAPPVRLVDEDDLDPELDRPRPLWLRVSAALVGAGFLAFTVFSSYLTGGAWSPITDAGDWRSFTGSLVAR